ncbi:zinc finger protein 513 isoform X2 [Salmo salar]|uniref:Zinc finger protein 513 n=1 Tax=Salmo salar TaxID=8030 RepID=A0A1S3SBH5_SALSA|nr:zinc finger protein 513-like isoform X2 [Salmo salar]|eukprot:XP_014061692.1 PREDICTED: zinc finger protein 513-like isoform X2 [Salmo salar]
MIFRTTGEAEFPGKQHDLIVPEVFQKRWQKREVDRKMPRRKQQNPQSVKLDSEDGVVTIGAPGILTLEADFLLGHDLEFCDSDHDKILGLDDKYSDSVAAEISVYPLGDEESCAFSSLSMARQCDQEQGPESQPDHEPPYLSCRGCGLDLVGPYCHRCCKGERGEFRGFRSGSPSQADDSEEGGGMDGADGTDDNSIMGDDGPSSKRHSCQLCGFSSRYANHVKRHMKTHNGEKPYRCPLCTYASAQLVNLQRHLRIHTGEKPYSCDSCSFACSSLGNLKRHQRMHVVGQEAVRPASGPPIGPSAGGYGLKRHREEEPSAPAEEALRPDLNLHVGGHNRDYLSCSDGLRVPPPTPELPEHQPSRLLEAPGCGPGAESGGRVGAVVGVKSEDRDSLPLPFLFTCRLCGIPIEDEDGSTTQICAKCTLDMLNKDSSGPNSPGERGDKVYTCSACPFLTHYPNHLARHMKTHSGEKPYKCPQCDYASAHFDNLKRHHRVHTGEKPYKCHLCDYACGNLANLKRHQRVHSGAKPFQCTVCSYSCNQSMNLKRHMLRHTGEKPYKCQQCGYTTGHWDNYKRHQKKHGLATDGWVKVQMPGAHEEEEEEREVGQPQSKEGELVMQYMSR